MIDIDFFGEICNAGLYGTFKIGKELIDIYTLLKSLPIESQKAFIQRIENNITRLEERN